MKLYLFFYTLTLSLLITTTQPVSTHYTTDDEGNTPLHQTTDLVIATQLLKQGIPVDTKNNNGCTFLHYAAMSNSVPLVSQALEYGANVNTQNNDGVTPLMNAIIASNLDIIRLLCNHGANLLLSDNEHRTAVDYADDIILSNHSLKHELIRNYVIRQTQKQQYIKDEL